MTALEFLCGVQFIPRSETTKSGPVSKGERKRMLDNHAVSINGTKPISTDEIAFPIFEVIFFPKSSARCTLYAMAPKQAWSEHWERQDRAWAHSLLEGIL